MCEHSQGETINQIGGSLHNSYILKVACSDITYNGCLPAYKIEKIFPVYVVIQDNLGISPSESCFISGTVYHFTEQSGVL